MPKPKIRSRRTKQSRPVGLGIGTEFGFGAAFSKRPGGFGLGSGLGLSDAASKAPAQKPQRPARAAAPAQKPQRPVRTRTAAPSRPAAPSTPWPHPGTTAMEPSERHAARSTAPLSFYQLTARARSSVPKKSSGRRPVPQPNQAGPWWLDEPIRRPWGRGYGHDFNPQLLWFVDRLPGRVRALLDSAPGA